MNDQTDVIEKVKNLPHMEVILKNKKDIFFLNKIPNFIRTFQYAFSEDWSDKSDENLLEWGLIICESVVVRFFIPRD